MRKYAALLRGINVGGRRLKMEALRAAFEAWGFTNVRTILASGNVLFEAEERDLNALRAKIGNEFHEAFGFEVSVMLRTAEDIAALVGGDPFQGVNVTEDTRLFVTFLDVKAQSEMSAPYEAPDGNFQILQIAPGHVISVVTLSAESGSLDVMAFLEDEFGAGITTRNWNTVLKLNDRLQNK